MAHRALVIIEKHASEWPTVFATERAILLAALAPCSLQIEHIGSTAVPGLAAKPIIDMMLGARSLGQLEAQIGTLQRHGYQYMPEHEIETPERRFLAKPIVRPRQFHLHAVVTGSRFWSEHILFRDALRGNARLAQDYASLKRSLAAHYQDDREGYTCAKSSFIASALRSVQHSSHASGGA
jgi:GrpB-like predicted nucleotidyltransferase (UPF0157 family)